MSLTVALAATQSRVDRVVRAILADHTDSVAQAMIYAMRGGKGLRGFLVTETALLHGIAPDQSETAAAAIECLHAYSLVHDDLPCMDDDDFRRGLPTVHRKWNEATAVLAGDALQSLAFELLASTPCPDHARIELIRSFAQCAGVGGMVGGQAKDMAAESAPEPLSLAEIESLQAGKTGALITWSATAGARMADADLAPLTAYGDALGLAFQIADDILDIEGDATKLGKAVGKDVRAGKATFVSHLGLTEAKRRATALVTLACDSLSSYGSAAETLREAAHFVIARDK